MDATHREAHAGAPSDDAAGRVRAGSGKETSNTMGEKTNTEKRSARVVAFGNQKGGTGKSTTCGAFAEGLTRRGYKVLVIDLDPQGNLTLTMAGESAGPSCDTFLAKGLVTPDTDPSRWIQKRSYADLIGAGEQNSGGGMLMMREKEIATDTSEGGWRLDDALACVRPIYDFILLDTPPNMGSLTVNALAAADEVVIPCDMDIQSVKGFVDFLGYIRGVQRRMNTRLEIAGVVLTKYRSGVASDQSIESNIRARAEAEGVRVFRSAIRTTEVVNRAHSEGIGIYAAVERKSGSSRVDIDYDIVLEEYLGEDGKHD